MLITTLTASMVGFVVLAVERGDPVTLERRTVALIFREACARAIFWFLRPLGFTDTSPVRDRRAATDSVPVLLIPGASNNRSALGFLRTFLVSRGFGWVWAVNPAHQKNGLAAGAANLAQQVQELLRESGSAQVDLVGHGSGGLVAAWYAKHLDSEARIRRVVTVGTPWRGTKMSVFRRGRLGEETRFGAHLLDDLLPLKARTISIWSPDDPTVVPSASATPDNGVECVEVDSAGHAEMLVSARVFRAVQAALS